MDRKGVFAQPIVDFYATVVIAVVLIIFFAILWMHSGSFEYTLNEKVSNHDGNIMISSFLKSQYNGMTVAEYMDNVKTPLYAKDKEPFRDMVHDYFQDFEEMSGCRMRVGFRIGGDYFVVEPTGTPAKICSYRFTGMQTVPSMEGKRLEVHLEGLI